MKNHDLTYPLQGVTVYEGDTNIQFSMVAAGLSSLTFPITKGTSQAKGVSSLATANRIDPDRGCVFTS